MSNPVIQVDALKKSYKNVNVLKNISFKVERGTIFALLGSNGSGKTTTVKILTTLLKADSGCAEVCNYQVGKENKLIHEKISLTGQYAAVDEVLTGIENLNMIGDLYNITHSRVKARNLLEKFGLTEAAHRRVSTYSGGMRRRIDIAMSLMGNPEVIFLDEPTTGLDPQSRNAMWDIIKGLTKEGKTIFLTTQYLEEAEQLADKIVIINEGIVVAEGTPDELKQKLPQGIIEFSFGNTEEMKKAYNFLEKYQINIDQKCLKITIITNGSFEELTQIFIELNKKGIHVISFEQKLPTLEDAFLTLIGRRDN